MEKNSPGNPDQASHPAKGKDILPRFSASEYKRRYDLVREEMDRRGLRALILFGDSGHIGGFQTNCHYLSNYIDQFYSYVVFPYKGEPTLFFCLQPHETGVPPFSVIEDIRWGGWDIAAAVAGRIRELGHDRERIGLVGVSSFQIKFTLPSDHLETLRKELPHADLEVATDILEDIRLVKSEEEIDAIRKGAAFGDAAVRALEKDVNAGMRERDLEAIVVSTVIKEGGIPHVQMFGSTSMVKPDLFCPRPHPSNRILENGDIIFTEISASYNRYSGQIVRPIVLGEPTRRYQELFDLAAAVHDGIAEVLRPGRSEQDVIHALQPIRKAGLIIQCSGLHGWGQTLERPTIGLPGVGRWKEGGIAPFSFRANMTMMIEPNPVTPDKKMGMFVGNLHLVTKDDAINLQKHPLKLIVV